MDKYLMYSIEDSFYARNLKDLELIQIEPSGTSHNEVILRLFFPNEEDDMSFAIKMRVSEIGYQLAKIIEALGSSEYYCMIITLGRITFS